MTDLVNLPGTLPSVAESNLLGMHNPAEAHADDCNGRCPDGGSGRIPA